MSSTSQYSDLLFQAKDVLYTLLNDVENSKNNQLSNIIRNYPKIQQLVKQVQNQFTTEDVSEEPPETKLIQMYVQTAVLNALLVLLNNPTLPNVKEVAVSGLLMVSLNQRDTYPVCIDCKLKPPDVSSDEDKSQDKLSQETVQDVNTVDQPNHEGNDQASYMEETQLSAPASILPKPKLTGIWWICQICNKKCTNKSAYYRHIRKDHTPDMDPKITINVVTKAKRIGSLWICTICKEEFNHKTAYYRHMNNKHWHLKHVVFPEHETESDNRLNKVKTKAVHVRKEESSAKDETEENMLMQDEGVLVKRCEVKHIDADMEAEHSEPEDQLEGVYQITWDDSGLQGKQQNGDKKLVVMDNDKMELGAQEVTSVMESDNGLESKVMSSSKRKERVCPICNEWFPGKYLFRKHIWQKHPDQNKTQCEICGKVLVRGCYRKHMGIHTTGRQAIDRTRVSCHFCGRMMQKSSLSMHIRMMHGKKGSPHTCPICKAVYQSFQSYKRHFDQHGGLNIFRCEVCHRELKTLEGYRYHMNVHKGVYPYKCDICGASYPSKASHYVHVKKFHKNPTPCIYCKALVKDVTSHNKRVHNIARSQGIDYGQAASDIVQNGPVAAATENFEDPQIFSDTKSGSKQNLTTEDF